MNVGFAFSKITPSRGTRMMGSSRRDGVGGCTGVHDDLFVRVLHLEDGGERVMIAAFDLCFLGREEVDRFKAAAGKKLGLSERQMLLCTTHTHAGPSVGTWAHAGYLPPEAKYIDDLGTLFLEAAEEATSLTGPVSIRIGRGRTKVPMSRRRIRPDGSAAFSPAPDGPIYDSLPVVLFLGEKGEPACALFSASCHPSTACGFEVSADYPGVALREIEATLGAPVMFLQGAGGDAKLALSAKADGRWIANDWGVIERAGCVLAREARTVINGTLKETSPALASAIADVELLLAQPPSKDELKAFADAAVDASDWAGGLRKMWAKKLLDDLRKNGVLPSSVPIRVQLVQLGEGLRIVAMEGEPVAELGRHVESLFGAGITIPVGYANGQGLYLPVTHMLAEGGYEVESSYEYGLPAPLAEGAEKALDRAAALLRT